MNFEPLDTLISGAEKLYQAVRTTLSPEGKNVIIGRYYPVITHDGVTVAEAVKLEGGEAVGANLLKQASQKLNNKAGDGTTTVTVLAYHILKEGRKYLQLGLISPMKLRKELLEAGKKIETEILKSATPNFNLEQVATVSGGDVGKLVAQVFEKIGDGMVTVEAGTSVQDESEIKEGYTFNRGYASSYFAKNGQAELSHPLVLLTPNKISRVEELLPAVEFANEQSRPLLIIADDVTGEALSFLVTNKLHDRFNSLVVKAPAFGERRLAELEDLEVYTGGVMCTLDYQPDKLGSVDKVISDKDFTTLFNEANVTLRVSKLNKAVEGLDGYERDLIEERISKLTGRVATIKVGGNSESEIEERKFRFDDAVSAVRQALKGGIVSGGGVALYNLHSKLGGSVGEDILKEVIKQPLLQILENADMRSDVLIEKINNSKGMGINVLTGEFVDMKKAGIVDPALITAEAVRTAVSVASLILTTGCLIEE